MDPVKILLISDEPNILRTLRRNLIGRGYEVYIALDDLEAYELRERWSPDLMVLNLDFTLVKVDGLELCRKLREGCTTPIIVLSSIGSEDMKIQALDMGADDYLVMPFGMEEFLARVRSSLRRWMTYREKSDLTDKLILNGNLLINIDTRQVTVRGQTVRLTPTEYEILVYLAQRGGKVVTHQELLKAVWGHVYGDEREYLRVFISQLRHKLDDDPLRPVYILTEPGIGYRFKSDFA